MSNREQELEDSLASLRPWELEDRIRQLEAEVRKLTGENSGLLALVKSLRDSPPCAYLHVR